MATEYVSREAAKSLICTLCDIPSCPILWGKECEYDVEMDKIPAADVRPVVHGAWEGETDFIYADLSKRVMCGKCGAFAYFYDKMPMNFCPNCGADMRG